MCVPIQACALMCMPLVLLKLPAASIETWQHRAGMAHRRRFASTSGSTSGSSSDEDPELELDSVSEYWGEAPGVLLR